MSLIAAVKSLETMSLFPETRADSLTALFYRLGFRVN